MAKKPNVKSNINMELLSKIADGSVTYVSQADGLPLVNANPPLIEVNAQMLDPAGNAACRITDAGKALLAQNSGNASTAPAAASEFKIMSGIELPKSKRGNKGGGAPKYPFDQLEIGQFIYVPVSDKHAEPVKNLGSTVSSMNAKYTEPTGETKTVTRTKRGEGNKAVKNPDGTNAKETVTVPVKRATRKFVIRAVKGGEKYGEFVPEKDGAVIVRVAVI